MINGINLTKKTVVDSVIGEKSRTQGDRPAGLRLMTHQTDYVTADTLQTFKVKLSKVKVPA